MVILFGVGVGGFLLLRSTPGKQVSDLLWRGARAVESKEYGRAVTILGEYLEHDPDNPRARFLLGAARIGLGENEAGVALVESALESDFNLEGAHLFLGEYFAGENRPSEALLHLDAAPDAEARIAAAEVLTTLGRLDDAAESYQRAISAGRRKLPELFDALRILDVLANRSAGSAYRHRERREKLRTLIRAESGRLLESDPEDAEALRALAGLLDQDDRSAPSATEDAFVRALEADPQNAWCRAAYASFLARNGRVASARRILDEGIGEHGTPASYLALAESLAGSGEVGTMVDLMRESVQRWPDDPLLRAWQAELFGRSGLLDLALSTVRVSLDRWPADARLLDVAGNLSIAAGDRESADRYYQRALEARPRDLPMLRKLVALHGDELVAAQGGVEAMPEHLVRTEAFLKELMDLNRWDRQGLLWQASLARARGRPSLALDLLAEVLKTHPDEVTARSLRGRLLYERRDFEGAMEELIAPILAGSAGQEDYEFYVQAALAADRHGVVVRFAKGGLSKWPESVGLMTHLGQAELELKQGREFLEMLTSFSGAMRSNPAIERLAGWAEVQAGREKEAERRFRRLLDEEKIDPGEFARFLYAVGRDDEAEAFLREQSE